MYFNWTVKGESVVTTVVVVTAVVVILVVVKLVVVWVVTASVVVVVVPNKSQPTSTKNINKINASLPVLFIIIPSEK
jgi:hypothetical protein